MERPQGKAENTDRLMKRMRPFVLITDVSFIVYWSVSLLIAVGWEVVPASWLFKDYEDPIIYAWNWSFFPLDMVLSACGLLAIRRHSRGEDSWRGLALFSLALTFCAGFMAVSFWAIRLDFDPSWWGANLFITIWPLFFLSGLAGAEPPK